MLEFNTESKVVNNAYLVSLAGNESRRVANPVQLEPVKDDSRAGVLGIEGDAQHILIDNTGLCLSSRDGQLRELQVLKNKEHVGLNSNLCVIIAQRHDGYVVLQIDISRSGYSPVVDGFDWLVFGEVIAGRLFCSERIIEPVNISHRDLVVFVPERVKDGVELLLGRLFARQKPVFDSLNVHKI